MSDQQSTVDREHYDDHDLASVTEARALVGDLGKRHALAHNVQVLLAIADIQTGLHRLALLIESRMS